MPLMLCGAMPRISLIMRRLPLVLSELTKSQVQCAAAPADNCVLQGLHATYCHALCNAKFVPQPRRMLLWLPPLPPATLLPLLLPLLLLYYHPCHHHCMHVGAGSDANTRSHCRLIQHLPGVASAVASIASSCNSLPLPLLSRPSCLPVCIFLQATGTDASTSANARAIASTAAAAAAADA